MPLSFQPACLPVAPSGLPHTHPSQAISLLRKTTPAVFTWPRLPRRSLREQLPIQSIAGFPGLTFDQATRHVYIDQSVAEHELVRLGLSYLQYDATIGALTVEDAASLGELLRTAELPIAPKAIVSHLAGPVSLGLQLADQQHRPLGYEPMLLEGLTHYLALRVAWLTTQLAHLTDDLIICLDEPLLTAVNSPFCPIDWEYAAELLEQVFAATTGCRGIIVGDFGARDKRYDLVPAWHALLETSVELIVVDVYHYSTTLVSAVEVLPGFLRRPGFLTWGLIPVDADELGSETSASLVARFEHILGLLTAAGVSRDELLEATLISTNGSLEHLSETAAEQALYLCADVSRQLRSKYELTKEM